MTVKLRGWASTYGATVRLRTVRQETIAEKHGTFPAIMYQWQLDSVGTTYISSNFEENIDSRSQDMVQRK